MSEELNQTQIVKEFLKIVKSKLPGWLKDNKSELKDVLSELESHIWEKVEEIAGGQDVQIHHVQQAVGAMGNPRDIAAEYKKRGNPKIWISKELFPSYIKVIGIVISVIVGANIIALIIDAVENGWNLEFLSYVDGIFSSALGAFLIVTIIFVVLSVEGYLPEDFTRSKYKTKVKSTPSEKLRIATKKIKPPLKRGELLVGGIIALLVGLAMWAEVWVYFPFVVEIGSDMTWWIQRAGIFTLIGGIINLMQLMMDLTNYAVQRVLIAIHTIMDLVFIYFIVDFLPIITHLTPTSDPILFDISQLNPSLYDGILIGVKVMIGISIFGTIVGSISNIYKAITLKMKFEEYHQYQEM